MRTNSIVTNDLLTINPMDPIPVHSQHVDQVWTHFSSHEGIKVESVGRKTPGGILRGIYLPLYAFVGRSILQPSLRRRI